MYGHDLPSGGTERLNASRLVRATAWTKWQRQRLTSIIFHSLEVDGDDVEAKKRVFVSVR